MIPRPIRTRMALGATVRELRRAKSWTQSDLARKTGMTQAAVSNLERGNSNPSLNRLILICSTLGAEITIGEGPKVLVDPWSHE